MDLERYKEYFSLSDADFEKFDHNNAIIADVFKVVEPSNAPRVLKLCPREGDFFRERFFLSNLAGKLPVPALLGSFEPFANEAGAILMSYIEGRLLSDHEWCDELAFDIGAKLGLVHSNRMQYFGDPTKKETLFQSAADYFHEKFAEELEECAGHLPEETINFCRDYYDRNLALFDSVDGPCVVHRDFRPGNLLVQKGHLAGIIDWAAARMGFAEQDFCSLEHNGFPDEPKFKKRFFAGYTSVREVPDFEKIMPLLRLGRSLGVIGYTVKSRTWNGKNREIYRYNRDFLDRFCGDQ
ncbi:MAG: aminoglycoside phosphotransferase family protein [Simkaniaceae bacterium]|nr:aminoglycoside phosphotransferase family protein [Simkaniaceae bacterium]